MKEKNWRGFIAVCFAVLIFPVLITFISVQINGDRGEKLPLSGKTVKIENAGYSAEMDVEEFIPCVLMAQMPIDSPMEAIKAQAVVIRTYILREMNENTEISTKKLNLPFVNYTKLKEMWFEDYKMKYPASFEGILGNAVGVGDSRIFARNMDYLHTIIGKTNMKVLKSKGELILPLYHGISNGATRDGIEVLGSDYNYLKCVKCDEDLQQDNYLGTKYFTLEQLRENLLKEDIVIYQNKKEMSLSDIDLQDFMSLINMSDRDSKGYMRSVKIADTKIMADKFAKALDLNSTAMEINQYEKGVRISTKGVGHGFGMSLAYAKQLAKDGMQWQKILKKFYDATISDY